MKQLNPFLSFFERNLTHFLPSFLPSFARLYEVEFKMPEKRYLINSLFTVFSVSFPAINSFFSNVSL